ncbi:MAG: sodium-dependent transporter [Lachnospirales bacterium]
MNTDNFKSKLGIVAATAGSAVGLGNLWGFSYKAGTNGGGTFVLLYLFSVLFIGLPVMLAEFIIGREGKGGPVGSIEEITKSKKSPFLIGGYFGALSTFLILSFYSVIAGWSIGYLLDGVVHGFSQYATMDTAEYFGATSGNLSKQIVLQGVFVALTVAIVIFGIQKGIEKLSKIMMPLLFLIILILVGYSLTLSGLGDAVSFLFKPSELPEGSSFFSVFAAALGQAFFSLSLGMGAVVTYARAVNDDVNINTISMQVVVCDTMIALLAGLAIFPIMFTYGLDPSSGAGLAFISLPIAFSEMPLGYVLGNLFFLLLVIAALTSSISMLENSLSLVIEKSKLNRKSATIVLGIVVFLFGVLSQLGLGYASPLLSFTGGESFLDQLDLLTMIYLIPLGALCFILLVGYKMDEATIRKQINNDKIANLYIPYIKYVAPILVGLVLIVGLM